MVTDLTRRGFVGAVPAAGVVGVCAWLGIDVLAWSEQPKDGVGGDGDVHVGFPRQDASLVREVVAASHGNFKRVRELVEASPALAKANWDWGFGDWESALGAAAHTGRRAIAEFLIEQGARPNLFSAAMLGQLAVVQAFVEATPGVQGVHGPHGITLLAHARAGGVEAEHVADYLKEIGGADVGYETQAISEEEQLKYVGAYVFGSGTEDALEVYERARSKTLMIKRRGAAFGRGLFYLGGQVFHPIGAPSVRIEFGRSAEDEVVEVVVRDAVVIVKGQRIG